LVLKNNPKYYPIRAIFTKQHQNASKNIQLFVVFDFSRSICGFCLDRFEFEHPYMQGASSNYNFSLVYGLHLKYKIVTTMLFDKNTYNI